MSLPKTIVVATDFSESSTAALRYAAELSGALGAALRLVHVVDDLAARFIDAPAYEPLGRMQTELERAARASLDALVLEQQPHVTDVSGTVLTARVPAEAIVSYARDVRGDLIVMGTHGRGPVRRFLLGSVAERVVRTAPCPVMTVHADASAPATAAKTTRDFVVI